MTTRSRLKILTSGVLLVLIITLSAWTVAVNARRQTGPHTPGRTTTFDNQSPHLIPATAFSSDGADLDSYHFSRSGGYMQGTSANGGCLKAPVYLPQWTTITDFNASIYNDDPGYTITVKLWRVKNNDGITNQLSMVTTGAISKDEIQVLTSDTIINPIVSYPGYSYYVTTCLRSENTRLYAVWINHEAMGSIYLPVVQK